MLITKFAQIRDLRNAGELTDAEELLIKNCKIGKATILGDGRRPDGPSAERTIRACLLRYLILGGCDDWRVHEWGVTLTGAWISEKLDLSFATAKGSTSLFACGFKQGILAMQARFEDLILSGSAVPYLIAQGVHVKGNVLLRGLESSGEVCLSAAQIGGQLDCKNAELKGGGAKVLNAQNSQITENVFRNGLKGARDVRRSDTEIGGQLEFQNAEINRKGAKALNAQSALIEGSVFLDGLESTGEINLSGAKIGGQLNCTNAEFNGGTRIAINAQRLTVKEGLIWRQVKRADGEIDLNAANVSDLVDDAESWNKVTNLSFVGLIYKNLAGPLDLEMRKAWLKKGAHFNGQFHPQPYQQLAKYYRNSGHRREAREILIAKEIEQRKAARRRWIDERHFRRGLRQYSKKPSDEAKKALAARAARVPELKNHWIEFFTRRFGSKGDNKNRDPLVSDLIKQDFRNQLLWGNAKTIVRLFFHQSGDWIYRYVSGYGYKPARSLLAMAFLIAIMTALAQISWNMGDLAPNSDVIQTSDDWQRLVQTEKKPSEVWVERYGRDYETFEPFFYAADVVIPIINIGQTDAWAPSTERSWWGWWMFGIQKLFVILGWVVTAIAAASVTNMIRRDD